MKKKLEDKKFAMAIGGADVDVNQMTNMYYGLGLTPWSFMRTNPYVLQNQLENAEAEAKRRMMRQ